MLKGLKALFIGRKDGFPAELTSDAQAAGRKNFYRFFTLNGISVAFLLENLLILYALRNGVTPALTAVLATFIHLTMPFMVLGKMLVARIGAARTWAWCWFLRYVSAFLMLAAPFLNSQILVTTVILIGSFGFALFRSMGIVATTPLEGEVTTQENRGSFLSGNHLRVNITQMISLTLLIVLLGYIDDIWVYQMVIGLGCLVGFYASTIIAQIPETRVLGLSARKPMKEAFSSLWKKKKSRKLLFAWSAGMVAFTVVIPFMMIAVKSGYGIPDHEALFFSLILLFGGIVSSLVNGIISDHVGPRPLLMIYTGVLILPALFWAFAPDSFLIVPVGAVFFIAGYCKFGIIVGLGQYFLSTVNSSDRVGSVLFIRIFSGIAAGLTGSLIGGGLISLFEFAGYTGLDIYRFYFRFVLLVLLGMVGVVSTLQKLKEWSIKDILSLLVTPRDMYALYVLKRLRNHPDILENTQELKRLGSIGSVVSEAELRRNLDSPLLTVRVSAMHGLRRIAISSTTEDALMVELQRGEFTSAWVAAEILGEKRILRASQYLREGLASTDPFLQGKCMVALVQIQDADSYSMIIELFKKAKNPRIVIHGANALVLMHRKDLIAPILIKSLDTNLPGPVLDEILTAASEIVGVGSRFYRFLHLYNKDNRAGRSQLYTDLDGQLFKPDGIHLLQEESSISSLSRILTDYVKAHRDEVSRAVKQVLDAVGEHDIPLKPAFCMALILSEYSKKKMPPPAVVD